MPFSPLIILGVSIVLVVGAITVLRLHAFWALILGAITVAILSGLQAEGATALVTGVDRAMLEMGAAMGKVALPIALASLIGTCLVESGAAERVIRSLIQCLGEKRADLALLGGGFFLSIPVFFDTVFFLLIPLAQMLALRTGRNYLLYLLAICGGGVITHGTVPPTPGPLLVSEMLRLDLGLTIVASAASALPIAALALWLARRLNARLPGVGQSSLQARPAAAAEDGELQLPALGWSVIPVLLPVTLIGGASFLRLGFPAETTPAWWPLVEFLANKNMAMLLGALCAVWLLWRRRGFSARDLANRLSPSLETAGVIILIISAGGAYGAMLQHSGLGSTIAAMADGREINHVLLAWLVAATIRVAQGSATVAMITTAGIMQSVTATTGWSSHPFYVYLAIGYGAFFLSWMNDSGFWLVGKMGGLTEGETLRTWTVLLSVLSLAGLLLTWALSAILRLPWQ